VPRDVQLRIDVSSPVPAYRQIVDGLRTHFVEGTITPGDVLPSVRRFAADLGIHFNTVAQAYRELAAEGWLDVSRGKQVKAVERDARPEAGHAEIERFRNRMRSLVSEARAQGIAPRLVLRELKSIAGGVR
jgi:GntR family transcriptional regulator